MGSKTKVIEIPENIQEFASKCSELAKNYNIRKFRMHVDRFLKSEIEIEYSSEDGRGRPCEKLKLCTTESIVVHLKNDPESFS